MEHAHARFCTIGQFNKIMPSNGAQSDSPLWHLLHDYASVLHQKWYLIVSASTASAECGELMGDLLRGCFACVLGQACIQ